MDLLEVIWYLEDLDPRAFPPANDSAWHTPPDEVFVPELKPFDHHDQAVFGGSGTCRRGIMVMSAEQGRAFDLGLRGIAFRAVLKSLTLSQLKAALR